LSSPSLLDGLSAITDESGSFQLTEVPAGSFRLKVTKPGYIPSEYGATRLGGPGVVLNVAEGQRIDGIEVVLTRGATISGTIRDARGAPTQSASVSVFRAMRDGQYSHVAPNAVTDDRGNYRFYGLLPGSYVVAAQFANSFLIGPNPAVSVPDVDAVRRTLEGRTDPGAVTPATVGFAPVYYPGVLSTSLMATVTVGPGEEKAGVDVRMILGSTTTVEGFLTPPGLRANASVAMLSTGAVLPGLPPAALPRLQAPSTANGAFRFTNVSPGSYTIVAKVKAPRDPAIQGSQARESHWARADVHVAETAVSGVALNLEPAIRLTGRVVFVGTRATVPATPSRMQVLAWSVVDRPLRLAAASQFGVATDGIPSAVADVAADGSFEFDDLIPGKYTFTLASVPTSWSVRSAVLSGNDVLDQQVTVDRGLSDPSSLTITLTDRQASLAGQLYAANPQTTEYVVAVFPEDRSLWRPGSRRLRITRPDSSGSFLFDNLPAGAYMVCVLAGLDADEVLDVALLETLARTSVAVTLVEGKRQIQDLRVR